MTMGVNLATRRSVLLMGAWFALMPCCCSAIGPVFSSDAYAGTPSARCYVLAIEGMTCKTCAAHLQKVLAKVPGVAEAHVNYDKAEAKVCTKPGAAVTGEALVEAVEKAGYRVKVKQSLECKNPQ